MMTSTGLLRPSPSVLLAALVTAVALAGSSASSRTAAGRQHVRITIGTATFTATLDTTPAARALAARLPLTAAMTELHGNEKYVDLKSALPTRAAPPGTVRAGDLMLYGSRTLVLFYRSFPTTYAYTRLGRVDDPAGLAAAVGDGGVTVTFTAR